MQQNNRLQICVIFIWLKPYFNICALIYYVCEGSRQPIANYLLHTHEDHSTGIKPLEDEAYEIKVFASQERFPLMFMCPN